MSETRPGRAHEGDQLLQDPDLEALEIEAAEEGDEHGLEINRRTVLLTPRASGAVAGVPRRTASASPRPAARSTT